jgi:hypothetical protein
VTRAKKNLFLKAHVSTCGPLQRALHRPHLPNSDKPLQLPLLPPELRLMSNPSLEPVERTHDHNTLFSCTKTNAVIVDVSIWLQCTHQHDHVLVHVIPPLKTNSIIIPPSKQLLVIPPSKQLLAPAL